MWSRFSRLLIGFVLLGLTGWFLTYVAHGWDHTWQREQAAVAKSKSVSLIDPTLASDPSIAPAKVKVIGPLATAMEHEQQDPNATDSAAIAEPASSAQPTAFDHVERPSTTARRRFHSTFLVKGYRYYQLLVPAHTSSPKLQGRFARLLPLPTRAQRMPSFWCSMTDNSVTWFTAAVRMLYSPIHRASGSLTSRSARRHLSRRSITSCSKARTDTHVLSVLT
jgi:hypothetical protein